LTGGADQTTKGWDAHFGDQVTKKRRLGEDLGVEERRRRLEGKDRQFLEPMEPARRMNIENREGENQTPRKRGKPALDIPPATSRAFADDVVGLVNRHKEGIQMRARPRLQRCRYQDQRQLSSL
jgi:hypothetical protein